VKKEKAAYIQGRDFLFSCRDTAEVKTHARLIPV